MNKTLSEKIKNKKGTLMAGIIIVLIILGFVSYGFNPRMGEKILSNIAINLKIEENKERVKQDKEVNEYLNILEKRKNYKNMSIEEKCIADKLIGEWWDEQEQDFKDKYQARKQFIDDTKKEAEAKLLPEEIEDIPEVITSEQ